MTKDGAVIAADRQASHGALGQSTVGQPTTKIDALSENILYASSGPVGLGQQFRAVITGDSKEIPNRSYASYSGLMQKKFREIVDPALQTAAHAGRLIGGAAQADVMCGSLMAAKFKDGVKLIEISPQCGMEFLSEGIPFVCLGSGKANADPFLRYMWSVFFDKNAPSLNEAVLAAYWTVKVCIDLKSFGVGFEPDVFVLESVEKGDFKTRKVAPAELQEANGFIGEAEEAWRAIRDRMSGKGKDAAVPPVLPAKA
nr:hypothetical protein [Mesorhizobium sp. LSJC265A00]